MVSSDTSDYITVRGAADGSLPLQGRKARLFRVGPSYPAPGPGTDEFIIPFNLPDPADVRLDLYDASNRRVMHIRRPGLSAGPNTIHLNLSGLRLLPHSCEYQLEAVSIFGKHQQRQPLA